MTNIYKANLKNIEKAAAIIKNGGIIALPTDTLYGISTNIYNVEAVTRVFNIKGRNFENPMISHIYNTNQLKNIAETNSEIFKIANAFWPGPLTLLLNRIENTPELDLVCAKKHTIAIRMPNHKTALKLLKLAETPLISTSANLSNHTPPTCAEEVFVQIGDKVDMILDDGPSPIGLASTIVDMTTKQPRIIRQGSIIKEEIERSLI